MNWKNVVLWAPVALLAIGLILWIVHDRKKPGNGSTGAHVNGEDDSSNGNETRA